MSDNEQKNETRETIDNIVFELREHDHEMIPPYLCFDEEGRVMIGALADRIEAAWARESKAIATEHAVLPAVCITKQQGNAAAIRKALLEIETVAGEAVENGTMELPQYSKIVYIAESALSAPARNCDRYATAKEAWDAYDEWTETFTKKCEVPPYNEWGWLFASAERKGECDA